MLAQICESIRVHTCFTVLTTTHGRSRTLLSPRHECGLAIGGPSPDRSLGKWTATGTEPKSPLTQRWCAHSLAAGSSGQGPSASRASPCKQPPTAKGGLRRRAECPQDCARGRDKLTSIGGQGCWLSQPNALSRCRCWSCPWRTFKVPAQCKVFTVRNFRLMFMQVPACDVRPFGVSGCRAGL